MARLLAKAARMFTVAIRPFATPRGIVQAANSFKRRALLLPVPVRLALIAPGSIPSAFAIEISNMPAASMMIEGWLGCSIVCDLSRSPDATQVEHGISMQIVGPPIFVGDGLCKDCIPRLGDIKLGLDPSQFLSIMLPFDLPAYAVEMFISHADVGHVDDEPGLRSVSDVEPSHQLSIVVEELRVNRTKEQERGAQHTE